MRLWSFLALAATAAAACSADAPARSPFEGDARLEAPVTAVIPMAPLYRVLRDVGAQCGVHLEPNEELRSECVTLIVRGRPAREVLQQLAASLDYTWSSVKGAEEARTYRLFEDGRARARRTQLRAEHRRLAAAELELQLKLQAYFEGKFRGLPRREIDAEVARMREAVTPLPTGQERLDAERAARAAEEFSSLDSAGPRMAFALLPAALKARLLGGERLVMAAARPGALPMPPEVLATLREARQFQALRESGAERPVARQSDDEVMDFLTYFSGGNLLLRARTFRLGDVRAAPSWTVPTIQLSPSRVAAGNARAEVAPGVVSAARAADLRRRVQFSWPGRKLQPEDGLTYGAGITLAEVAARLAVDEPACSLVGDAPLRAITYVRKERTGVSLDLTAYETAPAFLARLSGAGRAGTLTYRELFTGLAERANTNVHVTADGWVRWRSTTFFNDREGHIDPEAIRAVFRPVAEEKPFTPEIGMEVGKSFSYAQAETLTADNLAFLPQLRQHGRFKHSIDGWRLLAALSPPAQASLRSGGALRYATTGRSDRSALDTFIRNRSLRPDGQPLDLALGTGALPKAVLLLTPLDAQGSRGLSVTLPGMKYPLDTISLGAEWLRE